MHKHIRQDFGGSAPTALGLALAMAFAGAARADENDAVARLTQPESSVTLGLGHVSGDSRHFGIYGGQGGEGTLGFGAFSIVNRDDASGTWFRAQGRSMGRDNAELRLEHERQGHWQYFLELDQMTRTSPYEVYSRLQGFGSNDLAYPATAGAQSRATTRLPDVKTERLGARLGLTHLFSPELEIRVLFQNVDKKGERLFGRGTPSVEEFLAEPINSVTRQLDVALNYTGERFQLSGAYYGSWYQNADSQLNVAGGNSSLRLAAGPNLPFSAIALPPDNFAHQIDVTGGYQFTHTTRGNFTVAYTQARQFDSFISVPAPTSGGLPAGGLNLSGRSNLGGKLDTTLVNLGLTSRPLKDLFLLGSYRYEDRHDQTAVARYINVTFPPNASTDGFNEPRSLTVRTGKLEASYQLPQGYRLTAGLENEEKERSVAGVRVVGYRDRTTEASYRLELKRAISESVNGAIAYIHSDRTGSAYRPLQRINASGPVANSYSNRLQPLYIADRDRDRVRLFADWTPADPLTLQFALEDSRDSYGRGRDASNLGARSGGARLYSVDASWTISERWRANAWVSRSETWMNQADCVAPASATAVCSTASYWTAALTNHVDAIGVGVRGRVTGTIDIGADAMVSRDKSVHRLAGAAASLPDIRYDQATLRFFGRYAIEKDTSLRIDYVFDHRRNDDWTWNGTPASGPFVYTDGTYLYQRPEDKVHFIGLSVSHAFR